MTNEYNPDGKEIRFIDSHYKDLFRIPDGGCIQIHSMSVSDIVALKVAGDVSLQYCFNRSALVLFAISVVSFHIIAFCYVNYIFFSLSFCFIA